MSFFNKKTDASTLSVPLEKELHGIKIRKLPNGAYIKALNTIKNLDKILLEGCFPGMKAEEILEELKNIDGEKLLAIGIKLLQVIPEQFLGIVSSLLDIPLEKLINELSPNETIEILEAYWEANDLTPFFEKCKRLLGGKAKDLTNKITGTGSRIG